jgi:hypothetical protein
MTRKEFENTPIGTRVKAYSFGSLCEGTLIKKTVIPSEVHGTVKLDTPTVWGNETFSETFVYETTNGCGGLKYMEKL